MTVPQWTGTQWAVVLSLLIALASFGVASVTLYVAHLRGSDVRLVVPGGLYPLHDWYIQGGPSNEFGTADPHEAYYYGIECRLLVANLGLRPGILFGFSASAEDSNILNCSLDKDAQKEIPFSLTPGIGWQTTVHLQLAPGEWAFIPKRKKNVQVTVQYRVNSRLRKSVLKRSKLSVDLAPLYEFIDKHELPAKS